MPPYSLCILVYLLPNPKEDPKLWYGIGVLYDRYGSLNHAEEAFSSVLPMDGELDFDKTNEILFHLGIIYRQQCNLEANPSDAQSWCLLGRPYMAGQKYNKAYKAYQQAVYRDGHSDAYSRAIRINQISDAIDVYARASELDPSNPAISQHLQLLRTAQATGGQLPAAPGPQDVHPTACASAVVLSNNLSGPPLLLHLASHRLPLRSDSRRLSNEISLPPPSHFSPGPFRGGPPPPIALDEKRHPQSHTPLAPTDIDRPHPCEQHDVRDYPGPPTRDGPT
ncbi:hypothetical protein DXG01_015763 [Tephrocybe rancida]|nr:hypothetical protein DXG01_015763 [Tephrocybe rancida]